MFKLILLLTIPFYFSFANTVVIKQLQEEFNKNVLETNIFRKRFDSYLTKTCQDDFECLRKQINYLKKWDTVQNDESLKKLIKNNSSLFELDTTYWEKVQQKLQTKKIKLTKSQFLSVIDLNSQLFILTFWDESTNSFHYIGKDLISSGDISRESEIKFGEDHYLKTPQGIFSTQTGWRSDGSSKDDNVTLGYGHKDRYVFYFGKHKTIRYNTFDKEKNKIYDSNKWQLITDELNLALHSHKSSKPMGVAASHGCIRMSDELNRFIDTNLVLHKNMFQGKKWLHKYSKEPTQAKHYNYAGEYLIIFDNI